MSTTRRRALGAALAAPLLARFTGTASADAQPGRLGTISDGWVEVRWTPEVQAQLDRFGAAVEAVAPASMVTGTGSGPGARGPAVRFPVQSGSGDPSLAALTNAQGSGGLDGGIVVRAATGTVRLTDLRSDLQSELASGQCKVNGINADHASAFRCGLAEATLTADSAPPGTPMKLRLAEVPLRPTTELLEAYTASFGTAPFTTDTVLAYLTAEGVYHPPTA
jgi:hypothetical protein